MLKGITKKQHLKLRLSALLCAASLFSLSQCCFNLTVCRKFLFLWHIKEFIREKITNFESIIESVDRINRFWISSRFPSPKCNTLLRQISWKWTNEQQSIRFVLLAIYQSASAPVNFFSCIVTLTVPSRDLLRTLNCVFGFIVFGK